MKKSKKISIQSLGGKAVLEKYGSEYFRDLVNKRWGKIKSSKKKKGNRNGSIK
jgi:hypothetical protein